MDIRIEFYKKLENEMLKNAVWELICKTDGEFVPPLSSRKSSHQSRLEPGMQGEAKPYSYFSELIRQNFLIARNSCDGSLAAFMSFRHNYICPELEENSPSNYVSTVVVESSFRRMGITRSLYEYMFDKLPEDIRLPCITTRTWSTNISHIGLLSQLDFELVAILKDHRGPGIDTYYYGKRI